MSTQAATYPTTIPELEKFLKSSIKGQYGRLTVSYNEECSLNNLTVREWDKMKQEMFGGFENWIEYWASPEERDKAIEENTVWTLQWYPRGSIGFYNVIASSLEVAIHQMYLADQNQTLKGERNEKEIYT